jgi:hypothetical protein
MLLKLKGLTARFEDFIRPPDRPVGKLREGTARRTPGTNTFPSDQRRARETIICGRAPEGP